MNTSPPVAPPPLPVAFTEEDKTTAIVSYLTLIGFIVAIVLHGSKKTMLGTYHLRQSLGLMLVSIGCMIASPILAFIPFIGWLAGMALWGGLFVVWITGLIAAIQGERKPVAILGAQFERWFGKAFA